MNASKNPPLIFDAAQLQLRDTRGRRRRAASGRAHFLLQRCAEDLAERLLDINRCFSRALVLGDPEILTHLRPLIPTEKLPVIDVRPGPLQEDLGLPEQRYDIVIAPLVLHRCQDIPGALIQMRRALVPDGVVLAAALGGQTLTELRQALYQTDQELHGGVSPRVSPMIDLSQAASLLGRAGLKLPVVDTDRVTVRYKALSTLLSDLRDMGETHALQSRNPAYVGREYWEALEANYAALYGERRDTGTAYPARFDVIWMTGWADHPDQQKPLKPGSAKTRLADALGVKETKL